MDIHKSLNLIKEKFYSQISKTYNHETLPMTIRRM